MTREEAIRCLSVHSSTNGSGLCTDKQHYEAKQIAIKALSQQTEDAISRQAAIRIAKEECENGSYNDIPWKLEGLPSVNPQEPKAEWIPVSEKLPERYKEVIVTDIETIGTYQSRYIGDGYWECDNGLYKNRIIAWQPKLKPYEPQESEEQA